jgi:hypothetical protein
MRNIIKYILAGMIVLITSCSKDFVDLSNPNQIASVGFWKTGVDALSGTNAMYQSLITDGTYMRKYMWTMDGRADDCFNVTPITYIMCQMTSYTVSTSQEELYGPWECHYAGIWRANQVLDNIEAIPLDKDMNAGIKARCIGEAHFIRGLLYYNLVNLFQNVVVYTHIPLSIDDYYVAQTPPAEVWELVYQDFKDAIDGLWTRDKTEDGRATKGAAAAYLAKAYLMNQRYSDALPLLKDIIDGKYGSYALVPNFSDNFTNTNENNSESIFEIQYDYGSGSAQGWGLEPAANWQKQDGYAKSLAPKPVGWGDVCPTPWIWNEFHQEKDKDGKDDPRIEATFIFPHYLDGTTIFDPKKTDFDPAYTIFGVPQDDSKTGFTKFNWSITGTDLGLTPAYKVSIRKNVVEDVTLMNSWKSDINRRLCRYADILLLYAECLNETGQTAAAAPYIQQVRTRSNMPDRTAEFAGYNKDQMREQIIHERELELACEFSRYVDLLRWGWFKDPARLETLKAHDPEIRLYVPGREYLAIPTVEIGRNPLVKQNDAWN